MSAPSSKSRRSWLIPAVVAVATALVGLAGGLIAAALQTTIKPYLPWVWVVFIVSLVITVIAAVRDHRAQDDGQPANIRQGHDAYTDIRRRYLARVVERYRYLPLRPVDFKTASAETGEQDRLGLPDVYIALDTTARVPTASENADVKSDEMRRREDDRPLAALEVLVDQPRSVLLGGPGSGKSTFFNHLAFCLASQQLAPQENWIAHLRAWPEAWQGRLPVPIILREVAAWFMATQCPERSTGLFEAYLAFWLANMGLPEFHSLLCEHLQDGTAVLLLDGLDEVSVRDQVLYRVKEMIADLPNAYPETHMAVTCRVLSYQDSRWQLDADRWPRYELAPLRVGPAHAGPDRPLHRRLVRATGRHAGRHPARGPQRQAQARRAPP